MKIKYCAAVVFALIQCPIAMAIDAEELDAALNAFPRRYFATAWVDLQYFETSDSVPLFGGIMDFNNSHGIGDDNPYHRPFREHIGTLKEFSVKRIWFGFTHLIGIDGLKCAVIPCEDPRGLCESLQALMQNEYMELVSTENAVVYKAKNCRMRQATPDRWSSLRPLLIQQQASSHGYVHDRIEEIVLPGKMKGMEDGWMNQFFNGKAELADVANKILPQIEYTFFTRSFPSRRYQIDMHFNSPETRIVAQNQLRHILDDAGDWQPEIQLTGKEAALRISALSLTGENKISAVLRAIRPEFSIQIP